MLKINVQLNRGRKQVIVSESATVNEVIEDAGGSLGSITPYLDSAPLTRAEAMKSFAELGITSGEHTIFSVQKVDNA